MANEPEDGAQPRRIADRYRVLRPIGAGGMGEVHEAEDERLHRQVALKLLTSSALGNDQARQRLIHEARSAASFHHPGIVHVYDVGLTDDDGAFIAMELVRGRSLRAACVGASPRQILMWVAEVARTLAAAHDAKIVHRDIKPDNIMVRSDGRTAVLDFGIAKPIEQGESGAEGLTRTGAIVGTPAYLSPEQARGQELDGRSDLFALAVTAFEMLTGVLPWPGTNPGMILASILADPPRSLRDLEPSLPGDLEALLARALAKAPEARFSDGRELARALDDLLAAHWAASPSMRPRAPTDPELAETLAAPDLTTAPPTTAPPEVRRPSGEAAPPPAKHRSGRAALLVTLLLTGLVVAGVWALRRPEPRAPDPPPPSPLLADDATIACPPLALGDGMGPDAGWLAAAIANRMCRHIAELMGGAERQLGPPALIDLPSTPTESSAADPYLDPATRERAVAAARERAPGWLDGAVARDGDDWVVSLTVRAADDAPLARVSARGDFDDVVREATVRLFESGQLRRAEVSDPDTAEWTGFDDPRLEHERNELMRASDPEAISASCDRLRRSDGVRPWRRDHLRWACRASDEVGLDSSSLPALVATLPDSDLAEEELHARITELARARASATSPTAQAHLAAAESHLFRRLSESSRARDAADEAMGAQPFNFAAQQALYHAAFAHRDQSSVSRHLTAWRPDAHWFWAHRAAQLPEGSPFVLEYFRRAQLLNPDEVGVSVDLGLELLLRQHHDEARGLAVHLSRGGYDVAAEVLRAGAELGTADLGAAERRLTTVWRGLDAFGVYDQQDLILAYMTAELTLLRADTTLANRFANEFVLAEPPRLGHWGAALRATTVLCGVASQEVASACLERLEQLAREGQLGAPSPGSRELLAGVRASLQGDHESALSSVRGLADQRSRWDVAGFALVVSPILDEAGEGELAEQLDRRAIAIGGLFAGIGMAEVRAARRARARGDLDRAAALEQSIVDALGASDVALPAVAELR